MSKYAEDIRRIAKQKSLKGGLGDIQPRDPIPGSVTPFIDEAFAPPSATTDPSKKTPEATDPKNPNTFNKGDGTAGKNTDGFGGIDTNKNGPQDADDILDGKAGPTTSDSGIASIFSGGSLNKITGLVDCDTGKSVVFNLDGEFIPPNGWDDPDSPPPGSVIGGYPPIDQAYKECINDAFSQSYINSGNGGTGYCNDRGGYYSFIYVNAGYSLADVTDPNHGNPINTAYYGHWYYNIAWPTDNQFQIKFKDGKLVANQYDSEAPKWAREGKNSETTLCTAQGRKVKVRPASNGGTMIHEVNASGQAVGVVRVYNTDGTLRGAGDAAWIASQVPR